MRRAVALGQPGAAGGNRRAATIGSAAPSTRTQNLSRLRLIGPWIAATVFLFLLFRLLFGHLYVMRAACDCGHVEQWCEFNDRPYTIGVRLTPKVLAIGNAQHEHAYREPTR